MWQKGYRGIIEHQNYNKNHQNYKQNNTKKWKGIYFEVFNSNYQ